MGIPKNSYPDVQYYPSVAKLKSVPGPPQGIIGKNAQTPFSPSFPTFLLGDGQNPFTPAEGLINTIVPVNSNALLNYRALEILWYYPQSSYSTQRPPYNTLELEGIVFQAGDADSTFFGKYTFIWDYFGGLVSTHVTRPTLDSYVNNNSENYFDVADSFGEFLYSDANNIGFSYYRVVLRSYNSGFLQCNFKYTFV